MATLEQIDITLSRVEALANDILLKMQLPGSAVYTPGGLSDISEDLGLVKAGEFRSGIGEPGHGFTGIRMGAPGWSYDGSRYAISGLENDTLQFGLSIEDGKVYTSGGNIWLDATGIHMHGVDDTFTWGNSIHLEDASGEIGQIGFQVSETFMARQLYLQINTNDTDYNAITRLAAGAGAGKFSQAQLYCASGSAYSTVTLALQEGVISYLFIDQAPVTCTHGLAVGYSGAVPDNIDLLVKNDLVHEGNLISKKGGVEYPGYSFVPLSAPLTSTAWDGDAYSTTAATLLDLSAVFGVPANVKAVAVRLACNDSAAWGTNNLYVSLGPSASYYYALACHAFGGDVRNSVQGIVPCDANGDLYYRILASGAGTLDVFIEIIGYLL
jgi:hypothetical protein